MVIIMPYRLCIYNVTHRGKTVEVEMEQAVVYHAEQGIAQSQTKVAMAARAALKSGWIDYGALEIEYLRESPTPSGCGCDCYACNEMTTHCRRRSNECYI